MMTGHWRHSKGLHFKHCAFPLPAFLLGRRACQKSWKLIVLASRWKQFCWTSNGQHSLPITSQFRGDLVGRRTNGQEHRWPSQPNTQIFVINSTPLCPLRSSEAAFCHWPKAHLNWRLLFSAGWTGVITHLKPDQLGFVTVRNIKQRERQMICAS